MLPAAQAMLRLDAAKGSQHQQILQRYPAAPVLVIGRWPATICGLLNRESIQPFVDDCGRDLLGGKGLRMPPIGEKVVVIDELAFSSSASPIAQCISTPPNTSLRLTLHSSGTVVSGFGSFPAIHRAS